MSKLTIVDFIKPWRGYAPGEKAGFDNDTALALKDAGVATIGGKGAAKAKPPKPVGTDAAPGSGNDSPPTGDDDNADDEKP